MQIYAISGVIVNITTFSLVGRKTISIDKPKNNVKII